MSFSYSTAEATDETTNREAIPTKAGFMTLFVYRLFHRKPIPDDSSPEANTNTHIEDFVMVLNGPEIMFAQGGQVGLIVDEDGDIEGRAEDLPQGNVFPIEVRSKK